MKRLVVTSLLLLSFTAVVFCQSVDEQNKLRIAQALEQAGEFGKALDFYRQLHDSSPGNFVYFDGLRRAYMNLKQYDSAGVLIRQRLLADPKNVSLYCELGDAYFKSGKQDSAMDAWNKAIDVDPKNSGTYQAVAGIMAQNRLFEKAIDIYRRGEKTTSYKSGFIIQIARLYFYMMNYRGALKEMLRLLSTSDKTVAVTYIQNEIESYSTSRQTVDQFTQEMKEQVDKNSSNVDYRRILAFLYMQQKNYKSAYDTYRWLDDHTGPKGIELLEFAERAYGDEAYSVAANAFSEVSRLSKVEPVVSQAIMGYANSLRRLGEDLYSDDDRPCASDDSLQDLNAALAAYAQIIDNYPRTQYFSQAVLNSIDIRMNYFHDTKAAERLFAEHGNFAPEYSHTAALARIDLYMMEGRFNDALSSSLQLLRADSRDRSSLPSDVNVLSKLRFEAARALYYLGNFDSASYYLNEIMADPMSDAANEAIQLSDIIQSNKANTQALKDYAAADAMEIEGRIPEAALQLEEIVKSYPQMPLTSNARFQLATAYCAMGNVKEALKSYLVLAADSTGVFADRAQFRIAKIYEVTLHDSSRAVTEYENFLARFPNSIYQDKVRDILRRMLGSNS